MEWSINRRGRGSLRLDSLRRIAAIGRPEDIHRLIAGVRVPLANRCLDTREAEDLLAFASAVGLPKFAHEPSIDIAKLESILLEILVNSWSISVAKSAASSDDASLNRQTARSIAAFFARTANSSALTAFFAVFAEFDRIWPNAQQDVSLFKRVFYSLLGLLEGLVDAKNADVITPDILARITKLCALDFVESVQTKLEPVDLAANGSATYANNAQTMANGSSEINQSTKLNGSTELNDSAEPNGSVKLNGSANLNGSAGLNGSSDLNGAFGGNKSPDLNGFSDFNGSSNLNGTSNRNGSSNVNGSNLNGSNLNGSNLNGSAKPLIQSIEATASSNTPNDGRRYMRNPQDSGVISVIYTAAEIFAIYASGKPDEAAKFVSFCEDQLDQLEDAFRFHAQANRTVTPLLERAMDAHFRVFEYAFAYIPAKTTWNVVSENLNELGPKSAPLAASLARLTARLVDGDEDNMSLYFDPLLNYLMRLPGSVSVKAMKQFAGIFATNFRSETSSIKLLYTLTNKLSFSEFEIASTVSHETALEVVASLLSMIVGLAITLKRSEIVGLAAAVLEQKIGSISEDVDTRIIETWGLLAPHLTRAKFAGLLHQLVRYDRKLDPMLTRAVKNARISIARKPGKHGSTFFMHLLDLVVMNDGNESGPDVRNLLAPLAIISGSPKSCLEAKKVADAADFAAAADGSAIQNGRRGSVAGDGADEADEAEEDDEEDESSRADNRNELGTWEWLDKQRNAWFNLAALGFTVDSLRGDELRHLQQLARNSPPLVSEASANHLESDLKINPVLCRGASSSVLSIQHQALIKRGIRLSQSVSSSPIYTLFLGATLMLEELRSYTGVISRFPHYFADAEFSQVGGDGQNHMTQISSALVKQYVRHWGYVSEHGLAAVATNIKELLILACHRVESVRAVAIEMITQIVNGIPAALCQPVSLYAMFDCLTLLGESTANAVEDEYSPRAVFYSPTSDILLELNDNVLIRTACRRDFEQHMTEWLSVVNRVLSADLRSKLYRYLNKDSALGRGRRKALEFLSSDDASDDFVAHCVLLSRYESNLTYQESAHSYTINDIEVITTSLKSARNIKDLQRAFSQAGPYISNKERFHSDSRTYSLRIVRESVAAPFRIFTEETMSLGITFWYHILSQHPHLRSLIVSEVVEHSILSVEKGQGLFSRASDSVEPFWSEMEYAPTNKKALDRQEIVMQKQLAPHAKLLNSFLRSCMYNTVLISPVYLPMFARLSAAWLKALSSGKASLHSLARILRLEVLAFSINVLHFLWATQNQPAQHPANKIFAASLERLIARAGLSWYVQPYPQWCYGSNIPNQRKTLILLQNLGRYLHNRVGSGSSTANEEKLLYQLVTQEHEKIAAWYEPLGPGTVDNCAVSGQTIMSHINGGLIDLDDLRTAWRVDPRLAVSLNFGWSFKSQNVPDALHDMVLANPLAVCNYAQAIHVYLEAHHTRSGSRFHLRSSHNRKDGGYHVSYVILYWSQLSPIESINLLLPPFCHDHATVEFALRSLQTHNIAKTFFYVPQIVQQLRHDEQGNIEEFILETAKYSQKFAHQIIWNMKANMYMDDDGTIPSPLKPKLDEVLERMISSFDAEEKKFYDTEFAFFGEVTAISGKLKPYIKKSKSEKKEKIDEEIRKIKVPEGAYLPSHPDGVVLDIDRNSGKPLQSHAKAPFLATFKIKTEEAEEVNEDGEPRVKKQSKESWQGAIFKVGDDCRQDVLALQLISVFRSIFNFTGLDVYVFPNKVTATEAGRGVIDVLPNSVSRDMLGREAVNGLDQWFRSKHGGPNSIEFQRARLNFVKSMAAYSVISYLIQFKDRHNGNIMYDDDGHVIHIDFGFCFDIVPGGVRFEAAPFKLTKEMARVMGGNKSLPFRWFEELCIRAFLTSRVYADDICRVVEPMLESGLPCFKGHTIKRLRERFALNKTEAEAAKFMRSLIKKSYESNFTKGYDEFQRITNGIPY